MNNKTNIFLPKTITVGYQKRDDTYTKRLAYIIYTDNKGVLRKEKSWESWRDKGIQAKVYDNEPTEGFVLNKKVGGTSNYYYDYRQTYTRVYDPRGFEFEITIPNLLYILENCSAIKGKGLEGKFVYGWSGTELLLIPCDAPEYQEMMNFTDLQSMKVKKADLVVGNSYETKANEVLVYLGHYHHLVESNSYGGKHRIEVPQKSNNKKHWFYRADYTGKNKQYAIEIKSSLDSIAREVSTEQREDFAEYFDVMKAQPEFKEIVGFSLQDANIDDLTKANSWRFCAYLQKGERLYLIQFNPQRAYRWDSGYTGPTTYNIDKIAEMNAKNVAKILRSTNEFYTHTDEYKAFFAETELSTRHYSKTELKGLNLKTYNAIYKDGN